MDSLAARTFILAEMRKGLPLDRSYHSLAHTLDVYASTISIAEQEGVTGDDLVILKTAALFHDSGFLTDPDDHEQAGCAYAREHLPRFQYSNAQIERVCGLIMATRIPQRPFDKLSEILCDADLDYLGRPDFHAIGDHLYEELRSHGKLSSRHQWNMLQEEFLSRHTYFTDTCRKYRESGKREHLAWVRQWLRDNP